MTHEHRPRDPRASSDADTAPFAGLAVLVVAAMRDHNIPDRVALREALRDGGLRVSRQTVDNWVTGVSAPRGWRAVVLMRVCQVAGEAAELRWWRACAGLPGAGNEGGRA